MINNTLPHSCNHASIYEILGDLRVRVDVRHNPCDLPLDTFFAMAARKNKKRGFLFVSKLLGKHIPVDPHVSLLGGALLAAQVQQALSGTRSPLAADLVRGITDPEQARDVYAQLRRDRLELEEPVLLIGFAETATALGHAVFDSFRSNARYLHTTRERIEELTPLLDFQEEHSHATDQLAYLLDPQFLAGDEPVVLVDDEITTGKTALNIIADIQAKFPRREYVVASLLDWRSEQQRARFAEVELELGITIRTVALLEGTITVEGQPVEESASGEEEPHEARTLFLEKVSVPLKPFALVHVSSSSASGERNRAPYLAATGRFGLSSADRAHIEAGIEQVAALLTERRQGAKVLCLGTGEFMYLPMRIAAELGDGVVFQSTTRSPIHPSRRAGYGIQNAFVYASPEDPSIRHHFYNIPHGHYDELYVFMEREVPEERMAAFTEQLSRLGIPRVVLVFLTGAADQLPAVQEPQLMGSYAPDDVIFLLKDLSALMDETGTEDREELIQSGGRHYSEMLPVEYRPTEEYLALYHQMVQQSAQKVALAAGIVAERVLENRGAHLVLASLARAGTPAGILIKRYLAHVHGLQVPHYSLSIIRGKGVDENALAYLLKQHPGAAIQFVDGWTGKGAITQVLQESCVQFSAKYGVAINADLAVLADPGHCAATYGTREDYLIPSACLNATVSGLISRTVHRDDLIGPNDYHGAKWYREWAGEDLSNAFVDAVSAHFAEIAAEARQIAGALNSEPSDVTWQGLRDIAQLQERFGIADRNLVKPGVGETTRVLLRRVPWKVLVRDLNDPNVQHIRLLASQRGVPVEVSPELTYACCGIIRPRKGADAR